MTTVINNPPNLAFNLPYFIFGRPKLPIRMFTFNTWQFNQARYGLSTMSFEIETLSSSICHRTIVILIGHRYGKLQPAILLFMDFKLFCSNLP